MDNDAQEDAAKLQKLGRILKDFIEVMGEFNIKYLQEPQPINPVQVRRYAMQAMEILRGTINMALREQYIPGYIGKQPAISPEFAFLPMGLEVLLVELAEVQFGRKSHLFVPNAIETGKVRLPVRAATAAALHVFIERKLMSLEEGAKSLSNTLLELNIYRQDSDTHQRHAIPPATIIEWRKDREKIDLFGTRIKLMGPPLLVSASAAQTIGMAVHELGTNSGKYGALSNGDGRLEVGWSLERPGGDAEAFEMYWREDGGPPVEPPGRRGFGSTVIERIARDALDAKVRLDFARAGLSWGLRCPAREVVEGYGSARQP